MYTQGSDFFAYCGEKVLLRGVKQMSVWTDASGSTYPTIASFGTNVVRIAYVETGTATVPSARGARRAGTAPRSSARDVPDSVTNERPTINAPSE